MIVRRIKSEGLAHISYFIGSAGEAAVIDPGRDVGVYADITRKGCMRIEYILETHRNEDYVIGSTELAALTGATIYHGKHIQFKYGLNIAEGDILPIGDIRIKAIETPGHTPESMTYALYEHDNHVPLMAFTGDAIFPGSTGRTDLWGTKGEAAGILYDSIMHKILPLGDQAILYPAHGAGSVCGSAISDRDETTIGYERQANPDLQLSREAFIAKKNTELLERPYYFKRMEEINLAGPPVTGGLPHCMQMDPKAFGEAIKAGILFDTRMPSAYSTHIPGSYSIWLDGLATFPGWIDEYEKPLYLLLENDDDLGTALTYLYRIGLDNVRGYLCGGFQPWADAGRETDFVGLLVPDSLAGMLSADKVDVLDVRSEPEWREGHIKEAKHIYVGELTRRAGELPKSRPVACVCSTGRRASLAASILKRAGIKEVYNLLGGVSAWKAKDYPLVYERLLEK